MAIFGEELKRLRHELELSQTAFGKAVGYSRTLVSNWERLLDDPFPPRHEIEAWEEKLDLSPGQVDCLLVAAGYQPRYGTSGEREAAGVLRAGAVETPELRATVLKVGRIEEPEAPPFTPEDVRVYLDNVVAGCELLDLGGAGGPVAKLPLERVYVALKADPSNPTERQANERQLIRELERELDLRGLDERAQLVALKRFIARRDPVGLTLTMRDRDKGGDGTYLGRIARRVDLAELVAEQRWAVLLGDPGSGKTTLVRWLALQFARALRDGDARVRALAAHVRADDAETDGAGEVDLGPARLPVPVRLADYAAARWPAGGGDTGLALFDWLGGQPWQGRKLHPTPEVGRAVVQQYIRQGQALLLLDGLDEIMDRTRRSQVAQAVHDLLCSYVREPRSGACAAEEGFAPWGQAMDRPQVSGGNQALITSRVIGYYAAPLASTLPHYTVEEMSAAAIGRFCAAWTQAVHGATGQGDAAADGKRLRAELLESGRPGLAEIAGNPLLLTILAGLFYTLAGRLPDRRILLYWRVAQAFLKQRWEYWAEAGLVVDEAVAGPFHYALGCLAAQLHANPDYPNALVDGEQAVAWLEEALEAYEGGRWSPQLRTQAEVMLRGARDLGGFLLERGDGVYGFIHRTFQEYFAALYLAWDARGAGAAICARLEEPAWQEALVLTAAQAGLRPRAAAAMFQEILAAPEPTGGLLPRGALFVATCLPGLTGEAPAEVVELTCRQLIAAYANRRWPPDETSQPPVPLRKAIEKRMAGLQGLRGAVEGMAQAVMSESGPERLAAAELILALEWTQPDLVGPLITAARAYAEPVATVREALLLQYRAQPGAFTATLLPMRELLDEAGAGERLRREPIWGTILAALYLDPERARAASPAAEQVMCDSALTPVLRTAWVAGWPPERLVGELAELANRRDGGAAARDAGWALAVADDAAWRRWLADAGEDRALMRPILTGLSWHAGDGSRAREVRRARALDRALDRAIVGDLDRDLALALDRARGLARALDHDRGLVRFLGLDLARKFNSVFASDLALALDLAREVDLVRAHKGDLVRARNLARDLVSNSNRWLSDLAEIEDVLQAALTRAAADDTLAELQETLMHAQAQADALREWLQGPAYRALAAAAEMMTPEPGGRDGRGQDGRLRIDAGAWEEVEGLGAAEHARLQLPASDKLSDALRARIAADAGRWAAGGNPALARSGALLLAELGEITPETLPHVVSLLTETGDLWRYRARRALNTERPASTWGLAALELLARYATEAQGEAADAHLASTYCSGALMEVAHDRADWLAAWAREGEAGIVGRRILSNIQRLADDTWPAYLALLEKAGPESREALLTAASWLLRLGRTPGAHQAALADALIRLSAVDGAVGTAAITALGRWPNAPQTVTAALFARAEEADAPAAVWEALARVAAGADEAMRARVDARLAGTTGAAVDAAVARRWAAQAEEADAQAVLAALAQRCPTPAGQLAALLGAGADDDVWGSYHEGVVAAIRTLAQQHGALVGELAAELRTALTEEKWPRHRIALAGLAACAEAMPAQFNEAGDDLGALLLNATRHAHSHNARRFAITALSYLRVVGPEALAAILRLAGDVHLVQADTIAAARRFNRLDASLGEALPGALAAALHGESTAQAYVACELLAALGSSQAAGVTPGLRKQIVAALAAALRAAGSRRAVWLFEVDGIRNRRTLEQHLYAALLQVSGLGR